MILTKAPQSLQGPSSNLYLLKEKKKELFFKAVNDMQQITNELIGFELAQRFGLNTFSSIEARKLEGKMGLVMPYLSNAVLLAKYKKPLSDAMLRQLQQIVLFDILVGNADRHTGNIFVHQNKLLAFDHAKLFKKSHWGINFIKLDIGIKLAKDYVERAEAALAQKERPSTAHFLINALAFKKSDVLRIKNINAQGFKGCLSSKCLNKAQRAEILYYLELRKDFWNLPLQ